MQAACRLPRTPRQGTCWWPNGLPSLTGARRLGRYMAFRAGRAVWEGSAAGGGAGRGQGRGMAADGGSREGWSSLWGAGGAEAMLHTVDTVGRIGIGGLRARHAHERTLLPVLPVPRPVLLAHPSSASYAPSAAHQPARRPQAARRVWAAARPGLAQPAPATRFMGERRASVAQRRGQEGGRRAAAPPPRGCGWKGSWALLEPRGSSGRGGGGVQGVTRQPAVGWGEPTRAAGRVPT